MLLTEVASVINAKVVGSPAALTITHLLTDSRSLVSTEGTLFFALRTPSGDGHRYIAELLSRGVLAFVTEDAPRAEWCECYPHATFLVVESVLSALQKLASFWRQQFAIPVIGITGSNGKTIVKEWLHHLLADSMKVARSPQSYNSQIGVPLSVWQLSPSDQLGIFEAGISAPAEMARLEPIIRPTIGIITNIGAAHQANFASPACQCVEKLQLFRNCKTLIYSADDAIVSQGVEKMSTPGLQLLSWSAKRNPASLQVSITELSTTKSKASYVFQGQQHAFTLPFADPASLQNALHCLAACLSLGLTPEVIAQRMQQLSPLAMRMEVVEGKNACLLVNDSYSSDLYSLDLALDFMARRRLTSSVERSVAILSDVEQTGLSSDTLYASIASTVAQRGVDHVIGVGEGMMQAKAAFSGVSFVSFLSTRELLASGHLHQLANAIVLIKGARRAGFERVVEALALKAHATHLEINLQSLAHNLRYYRSLLPPTTQTICMIKASAYGAGAVEVAKTLIASGASRLAVAVADEGVALRHAGITAPIMVMNPEPSAFRQMFAHQLEPEIYSFTLLEQLQSAATDAGIEHFPIHLKLDTGMSRLGFTPETDVPQLIALLIGQQRLHVSSVFTHFAASDDSALDDFTHQQYLRFQQAADELQSAFSHKILRHACNTAAVERFPQMALDMVRLGIGLYGVSPTGAHPLQPVASLLTTILQLRTLPPTATVGYGRRGQLHRPLTRIAALPIGYADGLSRRLGLGRGYCLIRGQRAPYVGNICMDVCMVDVTDIDCHEGDRVEIFGPTLPVAQLAHWLDTIPYEVLTSVSQRVKRIYYE